MWQTVQAARYLNVPPWELEIAPARWQNYALLFQSAENEAQKMQADKQKRSNKTPTRSRR